MHLSGYNAFLNKFVHKKIIIIIFMHLKIINNYYFFKIINYYIDYYK